MANLFESETCSRCGGSGSYSYCQMYGRTCFKCGGRKQLLTKRGEAAQALYTKLLSIPASELQPGMKIREQGITFGGGLYSAWFTVVELRPDTTIYNGHLREDSIRVATTFKGEEHEFAVSRTHLFRFAASAQQKAAAADVALAYQRSLNKQGKPDSRLAKLAAEVAWA